MKQVHIVGAVTLLLLSAAVVDGCGRNQPAAPAGPQTQAEWGKFYRAHPDELRSDAESCGSGKIDWKTNKADHDRCVVAYNLDHFRPFTPSKPTFSSSGGKN